MRRHFIWAVALALLLTVIPAGAASELPQLHCEAALVVLPDSGYVLYGKNDMARRSPSSLVKVMTALVVLEIEPDLTVEATVSAQAISNLSGLATASLKEGEVMTLSNLLYCLLLRSGGDAANALAEHTAGSIEAFVELMNEKANQLGMKDTHFANPHGGDDDSQYTTAADIAKLAEAAMKNEQLMDYAGTQYKRIPKTNMTSSDRYYFSNNALVISSSEQRKKEDYYYKYATGLMTGFSTEAGYNIAATSTRGDMTVITVVLGASRDEETSEKYNYVDAIALMDWTFDNFKRSQLLARLEPVGEAPVSLSGTTDTVTLVAPEAFSAIVPIEAESEDIERELVLDGPLEAPVEKGEAVGHVVFSYGGKVYGTSPLVSQSQVERSFLLFILSRISGLFSSVWFFATLGGLVVAAGLYVLLAIRLNRRRGGRYRG